MARRRHLRLSGHSEALLAQARLVRLDEVSACRARRVGEHGGGRWRLGRASEWDAENVGRRQGQQRHQERDERAARVRESRNGPRLHLVLLLLLTPLLLFFCCHHCGFRCIATKLPQPSFACTARGGCDASGCGRYAR